MSKNTDVVPLAQVCCRLLLAVLLFMVKLLLAPPASDDCSASMVWFQAYLPLAAANILVAILIGLMKICVRAVTQPALAGAYIIAHLLNILETPVASQVAGELGWK